MNDYSDNETRRLQALQGYHILDTPRDQAFDDLTHLIALICEVPIALISLVDENRQWFKSEVGLGVQETGRDVSICAHAILQPGLFMVKDTLLDKRFANNPLVTRDPHLRFYAGALLETVDGEPLGTLCVLDREPRELTPFQQEALTILSRQVMHLLDLYRVNQTQQHMLNELNKAKEQLEVLASTDSLTGLMNRRAFNDRLMQEHALIHRNHTRSSLLMIDIDRFKKLNDVHGHYVGDEALRIFAGSCKTIFRGMDVICRWGGEEFLVLLPDTPLDQALVVAERLRTSLTRAPIHAEEGELFITISTGALEMQEGDSLLKTLRELDDLLYEAKDAGRDRVVAKVER